MTYLVIVRIADYLPDLRRTDGILRVLQFADSLTKEFKKKIKSSISARTTGNSKQWAQIVSHWRNHIFGPRDKFESYIRKVNMTDRTGTVYLRFVPERLRHLIPYGFYPCSDGDPVPADLLPVFVKTPGGWASSLMQRYRVYEDSPKKFEVQQACLVKPTDLFLARVVEKYDDLILFQFGDRARKTRHRPAPTVSGRSEATPYRQKVVNGQVKHVKKNNFAKTDKQLFKEARAKGKKVEEPVKAEVIPYDKLFRKYDYTRYDSLHIESPTLKKVIKRMKTRDPRHLSDREYKRGVRILEHLLSQSYVDVDGYGNEEVISEAVKFLRNNLSKEVFGPVTINHVLNAVAHINKVVVWTCAMHTGWVGIVASVIDALYTVGSAGMALAEEPTVIAFITSLLFRAGLTPKVAPTEEEIQQEPLLETVDVSGFGDDSELSDSAFTAFMTVIRSTLSPTKEWEPIDDSSRKRFHGYVSGIKDVTSFASMISSAGMFIYELLEKEVFGLVGIESLRSHHDSLQQRLAAIELKPVDKMNVQDMRDACILYRDFVHYRHEVLKFKNSPKSNWTPAHQQQLADLSRKMLVIEQFVAQSGPKAVASIIFIEGARGTMKTSFAKLLAAYTIKSVRGKYDPAYEYWRNCSEEYWDGMGTHKDVVVYDDGFQDLRDEQRTELANELIAICSPGEFHPNMAALEAKGKVFFRARSVIITSNLPLSKFGGANKPPGVMIEDFNALTRRVGLNIEPALITPEGDFLLWAQMNGQPTFEDFSEHVVFRVHKIGGKHPSEWCKSQNDSYFRKAARALDMRSGGYYASVQWVVRFQETLLRLSQAHSLSEGEAISRSLDQASKYVEVAGFGDDFLSVYKDDRGIVYFLKPDGTFSSTDGQHTRSAEEVYFDEYSRNQLSYKVLSVKFDLELDKDPGPEKIFAMLFPQLTPETSDDQSEEEEEEFSDAEELVEEVPNFDALVNECIVQVTRKENKQHVFPASIIGKLTGDMKFALASQIHYGRGLALYQKLDSKNPFWDDVVRKCTLYTSNVETLTSQVKDSLFELPPKPPARKFIASSSEGLDFDSDPIGYFRAEDVDLTLFDDLIISGHGDFVHISTDDSGKVKLRYLTRQKMWQEQATETFTGLTEQAQQHIKSQYVAFLGTIEDICTGFSYFVTHENALVGKVEAVAADLPAKEVADEKETSSFFRDNFATRFVSKVIVGYSPEYLTAKLSPSVKELALKATFEDGAILAGCVSAIGLGVGLVFLVSHFIKKKKPVQGFSEASKGKTRPSRRTRLVQARQVSPVDTSGYGSGMEDIKAFHVVKLKHPLMSLYGICVGAGNVLTTRHFVESIPKGGEVQVTFNPFKMFGRETKTSIFSVDDLKPVVLDGYDLGGIVLPGIPMPRISQRFITDEDLEADWTPSFYGTVIQDGKLVTIKLHVNEALVQHPVRTNAGGVAVACDDTISVHVQAKRGWCSLPAFMMDDRFGGRYIGAMIIGGNHDKPLTYYSPVTQELLFGLFPDLKKKNAVPEISPVYKEVQDVDGFSRIPPSAISHGQLKKGSHKMFDRSNLKKTFIQTGYDTKAVPIFGVDVKDGRTFDSNIYFFSKLQRIDRFPNTDAVIAFNDKIEYEFPSPVIRTTSFKSALVGNNFVKPISKDTSIGFGLTGTKGKFPYVLADQECGLMYGEGEEEKLTKYAELLNTGDYYIDCVYQIHRKDEKLEEKDVYPPLKPLYLILAPALSGKTTAHSPDDLIFDVEKLDGYVNPGLKKDFSMAHLLPEYFPRFREAVMNLPEYSCLLIHEAETAARLGKKIDAVVLIPQDEFDTRLEREPSTLRQKHAVASRRRAEAESIGRKVCSSIEEAAYFVDTKSKQRLMFGAPWYFTILFRYAFLEFLTAAYSRFAQWPITVGMSERSSMWTQLWNYLMEADPDRKPNLGGSDCPGWDVEASYFVQKFVLDKICQWYELHKISPQNRLLRKEMVRSALHAMYSWKGEIIVLHEILSSGFVFTNLMGGLMNWVESRTNLGTIARAEGYLDSEILEEVFPKVRFAFNGDDRVFAASRELTWYNQLVERDHYIMNFQRCPTPPEKSSEMTEYLTPDTFQFNSRRFVPWNGTSMMLAPLNIGTVLSIPRWSFNPTLENISQEVATVLRELVHHGKETYDKYANDYLRELKAHGAPVPNLTYTALLQEWLSTFS